MYYVMMNNLLVGDEGDSVSNFVSGGNDSLFKSSQLVSVVMIPMLFSGPWSSVWRLWLGCCWWIVRIITLFL